jgi:hypothetical protein
LRNNASLIVGINANALIANWYKAAKEKRGVYAEAADPWMMGSARRRKEGSKCGAKRIFPVRAEKLKAAVGKSKDLNMHAERYGRSPTPKAGTGDRHEDGEEAPRRIR